MSSRFAFAQKNDANRRYQDQDADYLKRQIVIPKEDAPIFRTSSIVDPGSGGKALRAMVK